MRHYQRLLEWQRDPGTNLDEKPSFAYPRPTLERVPRSQGQAAPPTSWSSSLLEARQVPVPHKIPIRASPGGLALGARSLIGSHTTGLRNVMWCGSGGKLKVMTVMTS
jgi:hypothetical protein